MIQVGFTTENCTVSRVGSLRYNSPQRSLEFCNGNEWVEIISNGRGYTKMNPGLHCLDILKTGRQKFITTQADNSLSVVIRELKQTQRRRKRERHLEMSLRVSAIIFQLFKVIMFEKCVLTILELIWNQRLGHKKTKLNICHHMLTSSTQLQNRSFHVVESMRTSSKCQMMKNARAKRAKILFLHCQICKFVGFLLPSSSWLLKLLSKRTPRG